MVFFATSGFCQKSSPSAKLQQFLLDNCSVLCFRCPYSEIKCVIIKAKQIKFHFKDVYRFYEGPISISYQ